MVSSVAVLAGGIATRLRPLTKTMPKAMLEIAGKPFIAHQLTLLKNNGISRVVICSGYLSKQLEDFVGDGKKFKLSVEFSRDGDEPLGTGGAIKKALPLLGEVFFVMYGDSYLNIDFEPVNNYFLSFKKKGMMTVLKNKDKWDNSNIIFNNGMVTEYNKKTKKPGMEYIDYGLSVLRQDAFEKFKERKSFDLIELYQTLIQEGQMLGYKVKKRFYEIGSPQGLKETKEYLSKKQGSLKWI